MASEPAPQRPPVSVCVPFFGGAGEATALLESLSGLELRDGDEIVIADNTPDGVLAERAGPFAVRAVTAPDMRSSYYARNVAADAAGNDWLLFVDADCRAPADLVERYFAEPIADDVGAVAGAVLPMRETDRRMARYAESRSVNQQIMHMQNRYKPFGVTANLLVRRRAWEDVGGFLDGVRSGGDADFNWRIQDAGWRVDYVEDATVRHFMREELRPYLRVHARYTSGRRWLGLRHPGSNMGPKPQRVFRSLAGMVVWPLRGQAERGLFKGIDVLVISSETVGYLFGNSAPADGPQPRSPLVVMADRFPVPSETFVVNEARALAALGRDVRIEARSRAERPAIGAAWGLEVRYQEDAGILRELIDVGWLVTRHPLRSLADLWARRRWRREEPVAPLRVLAPLARRLHRDGVEHVHVHFARRAALDALRIERLLGIPYSLTAHAWDIFKQPWNLAEKVEGAKLTTTGCDYNVRELQEIVGGPAAARIHKIVMGVDPESFRRTAPYDGSGTVLAIGRLLEKKGFEHLIDAAARLRDSEVLDRVVIVGDGGLRDELAERERERGVEELVELAGAKRPAEVRELLEGAALLAMPSVVAADGDRDSMPVVVKEALAMGVPVVASDEVGLPEVVREEWGRLVPPGDPDALAAAIEELLAMPRAERERMGERGREFVVGEFGVAAQAEELMRLIDG